MKHPKKPSKSLKENAEVLVWQSLVTARAWNR